MIPKGRSPKDKRIVKEEVSEKDVWWGRVNMPMEERSFLISRERAIDYLNTQQVRRTLSSIVLLANANVLFFLALVRR